MAQRDVILLPVQGTMIAVGTEQVHDAGPMRTSACLPPAPRDRHAS